jgi:hypothetical protein
MKKFDVVIVAMPYIETQEPMMAPAHLKSVVTTAGLSCYTIDANAELQHELESYPALLKQNIERWFLYKENSHCINTKNAIDCLVELTGKRILDLQPKWICLSLFSTLAQPFNTLLCRYLRQHTQAKIVLGGFGVYTTNEYKERPYGLILKNAKIIDEFVVGDGEEALYNMLTNQATEFNGFQVLEDLSKILKSNYDDYNWNLYKKRRLPILMNRGCVLKCNFCDIHKIWKKFKKRSAEDVFDEMIWQIKKTGITNFYFRDNIINASISEYRKLCELLAEYNSTTEQKITWYGNFNLRTRLQMPESDWKLTSDAGGSHVVTGIESLVDRARFEMGKKWTNDDLDFSLSMAKKYNIRLGVCVIIGYVTETQEEFDQSLKWLEYNQHYANNPIKYLLVGGTMTVTDLTDIYQNPDQYNIVIGPKIHLWQNVSLNSTFPLREERKHVFMTKAQKLGFNVLQHEQPVG